MRFTLLMFLGASAVALTSYNASLFNSAISTEPIHPSNVERPLVEDNLPNAASAAATGNRALASSNVQTLQRPLFSPTRRPFVEKKKPVIQILRKPTPRTPAPTPPAPRPSLTLLGITSSPAKTRALVVYEAREEQWVTVGDQLDQWTVVSISGKKLSLSNAGRTEQFSLFEDLKVSGSVERTAQTIRRISQ